jgi:hypothetical protein
VPTDLRTPGKSEDAHNQGHWAFSLEDEAKALLAKFAPHISWLSVIAEPEGGA